MAPRKRKSDVTPGVPPLPVEITKHSNKSNAQTDDMDDFSKLGIAGDEALKIYPQYQRDEYRSIESTYGITPADDFERVPGKRDAWKVSHLCNDS